MYKEEKINLKTFLVFIDVHSLSNKQTIDEAEAEFYDLVLSSGAEIIGKSSHKQSRPSISHFINKGKLEEIADLIKNSGIDLLIVNHKLSASQARNLELKLKIRVIDKTELKYAVELINKHKIPSPPQTLMDLDKELTSEQPNQKLIFNLINKDIGLSSSILKVVNSSQYNLSTEVASIEHAVNLLGLNQLRNAIIQPAYKIALESNLKGFEEITEHSHYVGLISMFVSEHVTFQEPIDINIFYLLGLFHDVGVVILAAEFSDYLSFYHKNEEKPLTMSIEEKANYNIRHVAIAVLLAKKWGLPDDVCNAIYLHHDVYGIYRNKVSYNTLSYSEILKLGHSLSHMFYFGDSKITDNDQNYIMYENSVRELSLDDEQIESIMIDIKGL